VQQSEDKSISAITKILCSEGRVANRTTVRKWVYRWEEFHILKDRQCSGQLNSITTEVAKFMYEELEKDDEFS
jgi:hypothetical protein